MGEVFIAESVSMGTPDHQRYGTGLWGSVLPLYSSGVGSSPQELEVVPGNRVKSPLGIPPGYWDGILNSISLIGGHLIPLSCHRVARGQSEGKRITTTECWKFLSLGNNRQWNKMKNSFRVLLGRLSMMASTLFS